MEIGTIITEELITTFAPDGSWQPFLTAENIVDVIALCAMLESAGIGTTYPELIKGGFQCAKVKVTIEVVGDINDAVDDFNK